MRPGRYSSAIRVSPLFTAMARCSLSPFQYGAAYSMNDSGEVVGEAWAWWGSHLVCDDAILISGGQAKDIGFWPWGFSTAIAINRSGHILGKGWTNCDGVVCDQEYTFLDGAFLFYALSTPDSSGWSSLLGSAINDAGQTAGIGNNANGQRAFLMTPIPSPTVSITSPTAGAFVAGTVPVYASATEATGVAGVQFQVDGGNLGAEVVAAPYVTLWNTTSYGSGTHLLSAVARDDVGVVGVQFKLDGRYLGPELSTGPYAISWNTASVSNGLHTLTAVARDVAGNTSTSKAVTVHVTNHR